MSMVSPESEDIEAYGRGRWLAELAAEPWTRT